MQFINNGWHIIEDKPKFDVAKEINYVYIEQQMAQMTAVIDEVRTRIISLQEQHDYDLYGEITGMYYQLSQMKKSDNPELREKLATNAITHLNSVRGKAEVAIQKDLEEMSLFPSTKSEALLKIASNKGYLHGIVDKYNHIEKMMDYYLASTQLIGYAYAYLGEPAAFEEVFSPNERLIANPNLQKLISAEQIFNENIGETWYKNPDDYLLKIKDEAHRIFNGDGDIIEVEVKGKELLELANDTAKEADN